MSRIRLQGLAPRVAEYVELAGAGATDIAERLYAETEGNPLFVTETIRLLELEQELRIPDSVREVIARRLRHLSPSCLVVLETASILGRELELDVLGAAAGLSAEALLEVLDEALAARIIVEASGLRFSHVLIRDTLLTPCRWPDAGNSSSRVDALERLRRKEAATSTRLPSTRSPPARARRPLRSPAGS